MTRWARERRWGFFEAEMVALVASSKRSASSRRADTRVRGAGRPRYRPRLAPSKGLA